jgi:hypothetical protein
VAAVATASEEAAPGLADEAALADDAVPDADVPAGAGALDDELPLLQPATTARLAVAARQAMRHRVSDLRLPRACVFIPPPSRGSTLFLLMGLCLFCGIYRRVRLVRKYQGSNK